jgi:hypothetical protein
MAPVDEDVERGSITALSLLVGSLVFHRLAETVADPDLWGHIVFGERILATRRMVQPDLYSYIAPGRLWTNHEWLIDVVFATLFGRFGPQGLIGLKLAVTLGISYLLYRHFRRGGLSQIPASIMLIVFVFAMMPWFITVRAHLATFPLFLLTLLTLRQASADGVRPLWKLPVLFFVWANLHGGFLAGLGVLVVWSVARLATVWVRVEPSPLRTTAGIVVTVVCSVLATLLNPFGVHLLTFLYETALGARPDIWEWQPLVLSSQWGFFYLLLALPAVLGLLWSRRERVPALVAVLLTVMAMPFLAARHVPLALLAIAVIAAEHIGDAWSRVGLATRMTPSSLQPPAARLISVVCLALSALFLVLSVPRLSCIALGATSGTRAVRAVSLLKQSGVTGNMVVDFDWGTYALARLGPEIKVSIDGRREAMYEKEERAQSLRFRFGLHEWDTLLTKYDTHLALVSKDTAAFNLMKQRPGWKLLYADPLSGLFGRDGLPQVAVIERTPVPTGSYDGTGLCFP